MRAVENELPLFPFITEDGSEDVERVLRLLDEQPISRVRLSGKPVWLVTRYADVHAVLMDPRFSLARAIEPDIPRLGIVEMPPGLLITSDPPEHTRLRRLVAKVFTGRTIEKLRPRVESVVDRLLDRLSAVSPPIDLIEHFAAALPIEIMCEILGVPASDRHDFQEWTELILAITGRSNDEVQEGWAHLFDYITRLVAEKRDRPTDDLLSQLIAARDEGEKLKEDELILFGLTLLTAGYDTTKNQLANSIMVLLDEQRDQWRRLVEHPELVPFAVDELLRYVPMFGFSVIFPRVATAAVKLDDVTICEGDTVLLALTSANRDAAAFDAPGSFRLERADNRHLAFGGGIHRCLGAQLAKIEMEIGLAGLLRSFPGLRLATDDLRWKTGMFIRSLEALPVTW